MTQSNIMKRLLSHIDRAKQADTSLGFADLILDFADSENISIQEISEIVQEDVYFKKMLMNDCVSRKMIQDDTHTENLDNWD